MKKTLFSLLLASACAMLAAAQLDIVPTEFRSFKINEPVTFTVTAWESKGKKLSEGTVTLTARDSGRTGAKIMKDLVVDFAKTNPATFIVALPRPGFILIESTPAQMPDGKKLSWEKKPFQPLGGAAVEPEKIQPGESCPADFDAFWQKALDEFKNAEVVLSEAPAQQRSGYKVSRITVKFPDGSGAIDGFLSIPDKPGKYPAIAGVPGAGPGTVKSYGHVNSGKPAIELLLNVHNFPTADTPAEQKKRYEAYNKTFPSKGYTRHQAENRDQYIFRKVWPALSRAVDYVAGLPEFDGKHFAMSGNSQGGGTALAVGSLNKNITCIMAGVPALCDHGAWKAERQAGWPGFHVNLQGKADQSSAYFDAVNFASRIKVPTLVSVGYVDTTCPPSSVYAAWNAIKADKKMFPMYRTGHRIEPAFAAEEKRFLAEQFGK